MQSSGKLEKIVSNTVFQCTFTFQHSYTQRVLIIIFLNVKTIVKTLAVLYIFTDVLATNNKQKDRNESPSVQFSTGQFLLCYFVPGANNIMSPVPRCISWSCRLFSEIREQTPSSISSASRVSLGSPVFVRQLLITVNENTGHRWETTNLSLQVSFTSWIWKYTLNRYNHTIGAWKMLKEILTKTASRSCR